MDFRYFGGTTAGANQKHSAFALARCPPFSLVPMPAHTAYRVPSRAPERT